MLAAYDVKEADKKSARFGKFTEEECCPLVTSKKYMHMTRDAEARKTSNQLFVSIDELTPLFGERISKLVRGMMDTLGIGKEFRPHSTKATSFSTALLAGLPMQWIIERANWSTAFTFRKHCEKSLVDVDCAITNTIQSKLLPQRNKVP